MLIAQQHTSVLIVGAGPSGLMMAAQLLRHGVTPLIIDIKQGPTDQSKALAVQARSLEIYRQMGVIDKILANGKQAGGVAFNQGGKVLAELSLANTGKSETRFPFIHLYQQSKNERLLLDFLTVNCCPVYWDTNLISVKQDQTQVSVELQSGTETVTITCDWLIGADGAHSAVRKQLQIPFNGDTYAHEFYLADAEVANKELSETKVGLYLSKKGFAGFFPMPEAGCYRIIGNLPQGIKPDEDLQIADILPHLNSVTQLDTHIVNLKWFTTYRLHHRMADNFRKQRCFLIGDAAHIHSPVGGQGMNTGLQDAYNLGWKLAGVVNGQLKPAILDTYATERIPVAKELLNTTDRIFKIVMSTSWVTMLFKRWIMPGVLKFVWGKEGIREIFFKRVSQIFINYRHSNISLHLSNAANVRAGDRLPYLKVFDEKKQEETDLHEWCAKPGFTLIVLGKLQEIDLFTLAKWIKQNYPANLNFFYLPQSAKNSEVFKMFEVSKGKKKALIVRPDMHIGLINDVVDIEMMDNYLNNVLGLSNASS
ncbi:FAD-dependent monooxygenase [Mucilaginibacter sp. UR6-11]|uniref:FAD-dependent monooxygenase n=1 Tax=Mucilaginibacter sp. UR6-11 TaxID=1435644 RepID=UPI001E3018F6|nr:FAD-dependent monooxygenase [Mucilaginibacter sp. UR6-11]